MDNKKLTDNFGHPVANNQNSLTSGNRGPVLLQDSYLLEKLLRFNRERIPERAVHATKVARSYDIVGNNTPVFFIRDASQNIKIRQLSNFYKANVDYGLSLVRKLNLEKLFKSLV